MRSHAGLVGVLVTLLVSTSISWADVTPTVAEQLAAHRKAARATYLLVTEPGARRVDEMRSAVAKARQRAPHVALVELDRSAAANRALVKRYGLAGARVPFVLVLAHNGAPGGGVTPGPKAEEKLLSLLPSPRKADTLLAIFERKAAFVVVGRPKMPGRATALQACREAVKTLDGKGAVIEVDLDDKAEKAFLSLLGADPKAADSVVHVYGLSGLKTGILKEDVDVYALVQLARKKKQCCPTGKCG